MRFDPTTRLARAAAAAMVVGIGGALAVPTIALAADGASAPPSEFSAAGALAIISVMAIVLFLLGLYGVRGAAHDARIEHDADK